MSDLTERNPAFRAWVESLPDEHWAKKDLSACRMGWDAATQRCIDAAKALLIPDEEWPNDTEKAVNHTLRKLIKALEAQK